MLLRGFLIPRNVLKSCSKSVNAPSGPNGSMGPMGPICPIGPNGANGPNGMEPQCVHGLGLSGGVWSVENTQNPGRPSGRNNLKYECGKRLSGQSL